MSAESPTKHRSVEHRIADLESNQDKKSWCDILQAIGPILIAGVAGYYTWQQNSIAEINNTKMATQQEKERHYEDRLQAFQLQSNREKGDTDLRASMFSALVGQFFKGDLKAKDKALMLMLFEDNFQESFNSGSLFSMVNADLDSPEEKKDFRKLALAMAERQELRLGAGQMETFKLAHTNDFIDVPLGSGTNTVNIQLLDIQDDSIRVRVKPADPRQFKFLQTEFNVNFFDMPLTDNTELPNHHRFAVTLKSCDPKEGASFKVFELPSRFFISKERPDFQTISKSVDQQPE